MDTANSSVISKECVFEDIIDVVVQERECIEVGGVCATIHCRTIRIGSFKYSPTEKVIFSTKGIRILACSVDDPLSKVIINIQKKELVKVLVHYGKTVPVIFIYTVPTCNAYIRNLLGMTDADKETNYYDICSAEESHKRITLLPVTLTEEMKGVFKKIFAKTLVLDELGARDANEILVKTCPKDKTVSPRMTSNEIRKILIYPLGKGGISINTEDYVCLAQDQFLNDVIIDFYLKYLCLEILDEKQRLKTHVFSSFFYKRLTTKPHKSNRGETEAKLTAAEKRHSRVKSWTKHVNVFEKDFIVIPINENSHWFLAIVCFPGMKDPRTVIGNKPVDPKEICRTKRKVEKKLSGTEITIGATTITPVKPVPPLQITVKCEGEEERDEAEGSDSELDMSNSDTETEESQKHENIKQPCILIFDSLAVGTSRSRVVATIRDYLTCELQSKTGTTEFFNRDNMKGACPKVPQQNNFTDCGLYLLQYVEHFFKNPILDYRFPIKQLINWFEEIVVTRKREEISDLIKKLVSNYNSDNLPLPEIIFPTLNGKLIEVEHDQSEENQEDYEMEEDNNEATFEDEVAEEEEEETDVDISRELESDNDMTVLAKNLLPSNKIKMNLSKRSADAEDSENVTRPNKFFKSKSVGSLNILPITLKDVVLNKSLKSNGGAEGSESQV